jgi:hypothetical protein
MGFHDDPLVSANLAPPEELWDNVAGFWDERRWSMFNFGIERGSESYVALIEPTLPWF